MEGNINSELGWIRLRAAVAHFRALFQPSRIEIRFTAGIRIFDTAFRPALVTEDLSPGVIRPELEATHSPPFCVVIRNPRSYTPGSLCGVLIITAQG